MERDKIEIRSKLTKEFFMQQREGNFLVSNVYLMRHVPCFAEEISPLRDREQQWKRIVRARVNHRLCTIFRTQLDYYISLVGCNYPRDPGTKNTIY